MRTTTSLLLIVFAALALAACGGPNDSSKELAAACERQIEEVRGAQEEGGSTAKSTATADEQEQLSECAGQPALVAGAAEGDQATSDDEKSPPKGDAEADKPAPDAAPDEQPAELDAAARGLFVTSCGGCHALSDADTSGAVGPDLDGLGLDAAAVGSQIENGGGGMPGGLLSGDDADAVATYVAAASAK